MKQEPDTPIYKDDVEALHAFKNIYHKFTNEIGKVIIGQESVVQNVILSIFSQGHGLLVGVPGLAKTLLVSTIAKTLGLSHSRIQFTPDLMPSDIIGTEILNEKRQFVFHKGPVFANIVLADEINRTPPKTQSALLEAMQEKSVTVAGNAYALPHPFFVLATQNPIEQEGTYPLPEAQLDRCMFNITLDYPSPEEELKIVKATTGAPAEAVNKVLSAPEILFFQQLIRKIPVPEAVYQYAVNLTASSRPQTEKAHPLADKYLHWGAGPRATQFLVIAAKTHAAMMGRFNPEVQDVKVVAQPILYHRLVRNYKAEAEGFSINHIIDELVASARF
jgi:MoxR-like ATPase